ncbi:MAG: aminoacyl-histidine dipeptidase [Clostridiales bacterium]|nr:aminoacyl-histidine dipeptidase [Clostridiales bacterium]
MGKLEMLEPQKVFHFFEEISQIPRGSGNERGISNYLVDFANKRGLDVIQDHSLNVLIKKPGSAGYEDSPALIIQGHIDMVCEKAPDSTHNFEKDPLSLVIENDFIRAIDTTLGADDGIAVAYALALLDADDICHPPLEAVFTTDEEVGMRGADTFDVSLLKGKRMLNMDTEEEGKLLVSCCGGRKATIELPVAWESADEKMITMIVKVNHLTGGHSGADIHLQRANANKLLGRVMYALDKKFEFSIASINGGFMDNAITRDASAIILVNREDKEKIADFVEELMYQFRDEYEDTEKNLEVTALQSQSVILNVFTETTKERVISILMLIPYGVLSMCMDMAGLVESSNNLGIVQTRADSVIFCSAIRSSIASLKEDIYNRLCCIATLNGAKIRYRGDYPSWRFRPDSKILALFKETYLDVFGKEPSVEAIHAGLECGIFADKIPDLDIISIGPQMWDVHTTKEHLSISSVARTWNYIKAVLKRMKE